MYRESHISQSISSCVHTKNIFSLMDIEQDSAQGKFLNRHREECSLCKKQYDIFKQKMLAAEIFIPRPVMDKELKDTYDREIAEILKNLAINDNVVRKINLVKKWNSFNYISEQILNHLFTKSMFISYAIGAVIYFIFKYA